MILEPHWVKKWERGICSKRLKGKWEHSALWMHWAPTKGQCCRHTGEELYDSSLEVGSCSSHSTHVHLKVTHCRSSEANKWVPRFFAKARPQLWHLLGIRALQALQPLQGSPPINTFCFLWRISVLRSSLIRWQWCPSAPCLAIAQSTRCHRCPWKGCRKSVPHPFPLSLGWQQCYRAVPTAASPTAPRKAGSPHAWPWLHSPRLLLLTGGVNTPRAAGIKDPSQFHYSEAEIDCERGN